MCNELRQRVDEVRAVVDQLMTPAGLAQLLLARVVAAGCDPVIVDQTRRLLRLIVATTVGG